MISSPRVARCRAGWPAERPDAVHDPEIHFLAFRRISRVTFSGSRRTPGRSRGMDVSQAGRPREARISGDVRHDAEFNL
jgi:hypothetical protein